MPWWLELFGGLALKIGVAALEKKFPGVKNVLDQILRWLGQQTAQGNPQATSVLAAHVDKLCTGVGCPADTKKE